MERHRPSPSWIRIALLTGTVAGVLWLWVWKVPFTPEPLWWALYWLLMFPGVVVILPAMLIQHEVHDLWPGWFVVGAVLNWLLYTQLVFMLLRWRNRRQQSRAAAASPTAQKSGSQRSEL